MAPNFSETKKPWLSRTLLGFGLTSFFNDFSHEMVTALLPALVQTIAGASLAPTMLGIIAGISNGASTLMRFFIGRLSDKVEHHKPFLIIGYTLTPLFSGLIGTAHAIWQVILYRTLAWVGRGMREPVRDAWLSKIVAPEHYGQAFGFNRALDTLGAVVGPLTVFITLHYYSIETICFLSFIPGVLSVLSLLIFTRETTIPLSLSQLQEKYGSSAQLSPEFKSFCIALFVFGIANFNKTLIIYRAQEILTVKATSSLGATGWAIMLYTLFNVIRALSEYTIGTLSDILNRKVLLAILGFGLFGCVSLALLTQSTTLSIWVAIFIAAGISSAAVTTLEKAYAADILAPSIRGTGYGLIQTIDGIGDMVSSIIVGLLWSFISPTVSFVYAALLSFFATLILLRNQKA